MEILRHCDNDAWCATVWYCLGLLSIQLDLRLKLLTCFWTGTSSDEQHGAFGQRQLHHLGEDRSWERSVDRSRLGWASCCHWWRCVWCRFSKILPQHLVAPVSAFETADGMVGVWYPGRWLHWCWCGGGKGIAWHSGKPFFYEKDQVTPGRCAKLVFTL